MARNHGHDDVLDVARSMAGSLAARADAAEHPREIHPDTVDELRANGLLRVCNPKRFGGLGLDFDTGIEVARELAKPCGSTGWCYGVWLAHNWEAGFYELEAQEEYFAEGPDVVCSSGLNPHGGRATEVSGGFTLRGQWDFSSGCDASSWAMLAALVDDRGIATFMLPRHEWTIVDTWHVSGLRGTGSKDVLVDDVFVPAHRVVWRKDMVNGTTPGGSDSHMASFKIPPYSIQAFSVTYPLLGMAEGAVDVFEERARTHVTGMASEQQRDLVRTHLRLAESAAEVNAGLTIARAAVSRLLTVGAAEEELTLDDRAAAGRDRSFSVRLGVSAVNRLFDASGAHALFDSSPLQRIHRDIHAGSHQVGVVWDIYAEEYGRVRLGLPPKTPFI